METFLGVNIAKPHEEESRRHRPPQSRIRLFVVALTNGVNRGNSVSGGAIGGGGVYVEGDKDEPSKSTSLVLSVNMVMGSEVLLQDMLLLKIDQLGEWMKICRGMGGNWSPTQVVG